MPGAHGLHRLTLAAVGRAPEGPVFARADGVATIPEFGGDAAVAGMCQHPRFLAALDLPGNFRGKLEMVALIVDGPGAVRLHQNGIVRIGDQVFVTPRARQNADIRHANDRQAIPGFRAHRAAGIFEADGYGRFAIRQVAGEQSVGNNRRALRGYAFIVVAECAESRAVLEARVGDNIHDVRAVAELAQFFERQETHAREIRFHAEHAVQLNGMADGFVNLQAELRAVENDRLRALGRLRRG